MSPAGQLTKLLAGHFFIFAKMGFRDFVQERVDDFVIIPIISKRIDVSLCKGYNESARWGPGTCGK